MSLRNYVTPYPQLSVNGPPPPHHQTHRVQAVPIATLQQQISQQQQQQQQQQQNSANSNQQNGVQATQSHPEYHLLPFPTSANASLPPNFIRHMPNGGYAQPHQQSQGIYQTQGVVQNQQSQSNSAQSMSNAVQQNQARLTPMSQPTAPPTPPTQQQQQQQQPQGAPQFTVQLQQGISSAGGGAGNARAAPYRQQSQPRRPAPINQQYIYGQQMYPYGAFMMPSHVRAPFMAPTGYMQMPQVFNQYATASYGQLAAPSNGQQRQNTQPQAAAPMTQQPSEYGQYTGMDVYPQTVMQAPSVPTQQAPPPPAQKTIRKPGSKALQIINPLTRKNIFEEDSTSGAGAATTAAIATVDKAITASHNELNKDEAVESVVNAATTTVVNAEPSTPVVSAMSDGPSVDITPKHQVNKIKKVKPPEPAPTPIVQTPPPVVTPQTVSEPPKPVEPEAVVVVAPPVVVAPVETTQLPQDNENNNVNMTSMPPVVEAIVTEPEPIEVEETTVPISLDVNDNYQKEEEEEEEEEVEETVQPVPQDSNNNTDDKSVMTSPSIRAAPQESATASRKVSSVDGPIDYDDDQWSPANQSGRKYYTRDQLLKLKDQPIASVAPPITKLLENVANVLMKNNKELLTSTLTQSMPPMASGSMQRGNVGFDPINSLTPKFMNQQAMGGRNTYQKRPSQQGNKQQSAQGGRGSQQGIIKLTLSLQDDVKLNEASNAWKPSHLVKKQDMSEEERTTHDLLSRFRSMLNKLTAENFDVLVQQVKTQYKIDTSERLDGVISLVFEKAISEPKFAPTYAKLCKEVAGITTAPGEQSKKNSLKVKLITQCQKEFERHKEESIVFNNIEEKLREIENLPEPEKRDEEKARLEEEHYKVRQRANGTVKFIGELYKIDMLTVKIMHACIDMLLQEVTEEKIERVCKLLTTIGGKMEKDDGPSRLDKYFNQLREMVHPNHKIIKSSRIKFEIQNLQDLRTSGWKSRRQEATPRTMDQIQQETEKEQQMINYQTRQNAKDDRNRGGYNNNNNNNRRGQQQQDNDGWLVQTNKNRSQPIPFNKIALPQTASDGQTLGNPSAYQNFMPNPNKFAVLPVDSESDGPSRYGFGGGSKNSSMERGSARQYGNGGGNAPYSGRSSGSRNSSQNRSRDNSDVRGGPSRSLQAPPRHHQQAPPSSSSMSFSGALKQPQKVINAEPMSREDIDKNYKKLLKTADKYREDLLTTEMAMDEIKPLTINKDVLLEIYNQYFDRKDKDRVNLMLLISEMLKTKKVTREENKAALIETMRLAGEMIIDLPKIYEYTAQFLAELLVSSTLTFQEVYQICEEDLKTRGEEMLRNIFNAIEKGHKAGKLKQVIDESNIELGKFISDGNLSRWLEVNKFMVRKETRSNADVMTNIKKMLDEKKSLEVIMNYINSTDVQSDPHFIRNLTTVVIENCCDEYPGSTTVQPSYKLQNVRLGDLSQLLQRYIDNETQRELQCINALQNFALDREYPSGLLNSTFEVLYDNDVLSCEAFYMWKNDDENQQGKGVAVCSTRQFFTKLEEDKDDDDCDLTEGE